MIVMPEMAYCTGYLTAALAGTCHQMNTCLRSGATVSAGAVL